MPVITLPDGSQRSFDHAVSTYDVAADSVPATQFEKIFRLLCNVPNQGILLYHQAIQGTIILIITVFRILINTIR